MWNLNDETPGAVRPRRSSRRLYQTPSCHRTGRADGHADGTAASGRLVGLALQIGDLVGLGVGLLLRAAELLLGLALALLLPALAAQTGVIRQVACSLLHTSRDLVHDAHEFRLLWWGTSQDLCPSAGQGKQTRRTQSASRPVGGGSSSSSRGGSCAAIHVCTIRISSTASGGIGLRRTGRVSSARCVRSAISSG